MTGIVPIEGDDVILRAVLGQANLFQGLSLAIFDNNIGPSKSSTYGDFHQPTGDPFYSPILLNSGSWIVNTDPSGKTGFYPLQAFQLQNPNTIYGALLFADIGSGNVCVLAFRFDTPVVIPPIGGACGVTITQFNVH